MELLFTAGDTPVGRAIRYLTKEPMSHVAIKCGDWVVHSSIWGPEIKSYETFLSHYTIVGTITLPAAYTSAKVLSLISRYDNRFYDYGCLLYLGLRYSMLRLFNISLPKVNLWQISGMFTCTEFVSELVFGYEDSLITPYGLFVLLSKEYPYELSISQETAPKRPL